MASDLAHASIWDFYQPSPAAAPDATADQAVDSDRGTDNLSISRSEAEQLARSSSALSRASSSGASSSARARAKTATDRMPRNTHEDADFHQSSSSSSRRTARRYTSDRPANSEALARRRNSNHGDKRRDAWTSGRGSFSQTPAPQQVLVPARRRAFESPLEPAFDPTPRRERPISQHSLTSPSMVSFLSNTTASSGSSGSTVTQIRHPPPRAPRKALGRPTFEADEDGDGEESDTAERSRRHSLQPSVADGDEAAADTDHDAARGRHELEGYHSDSSIASGSPSESGSSGTAATSFTHSSSHSSSPDLPRKRFLERRAASSVSASSGDRSILAEEDEEDEIREGESRDEEKEDKQSQDPQQLTVAVVDAPPPAPSPPRTAYRHRHPVPPLPQYSFQSAPSIHAANAPPAHPHSHPQYPVQQPSFQPSPQPSWRLLPAPPPQADHPADHFVRYHQPPHLQNPPSAPRRESSLSRAQRTCHESLASALSAPEGALPPIYRSFGRLQHRMLLRLQDELTEMESLLGYYDEMSSRFAHAPGPATDGHSMSRSSTSSDGSAGGGEQAFDPSGYAYLRDDLFARITSKIAQYDQAVARYRRLAQDCDAAKPADVQRYKGWLETHLAAEGHRVRTLDHAVDLVDLSLATPQKTSASRDGVAALLHSVPLARQMLIAPPLALFVMLMVLHTVPYTMSRLVLVVLSAAGCWVALRSPHLSHAVSHQDALLCVGLYAGLMSVFALSLATG